jgi:hypothetical protein
VRRKGFCHRRSLDSHRKPCHLEQHPIRCGGDALVGAAQCVAVKAPQRIRRHQTQAHLAAHHDPRRVIEWTNDSGEQPISENNTPPGSFAGRCGAARVAPPHPWRAGVWVRPGRASWLAGCKARPTVARQRRTRRRVREQLAPASPLSPAPSEAAGTRATNQLRRAGYRAPQWPVYDGDHLTLHRTCVILFHADSFTTRRHTAQIVSVQNDRGSRYKTGAVPQLCG